MIDDQVGRMVAALKEAGLFENTIVIFNSDHGDYLGDFDLLLKGALPFRSVTQVPMTWSDPMQQTVARTQALASTIDISASILARAGLALTTEYRVAVFRTVWRRMYRTVMRCW